MFIRFVVGADHEHHRWLSGVIIETRLLREEDQLYPYEDEWLEEIYDWFNAKLPTPLFSIGRSSRDAVARFKAESAV